MLQSYSNDVWLEVTEQCISAGEEPGERTMVSVLCAQRDRFRKRANELEEELSQVGGSLVHD